jgi:hypothetical protein
MVLFVILINKILSRESYIMQIQFSCDFDVFIESCELSVILKGFAKLLPLIPMTANNGWIL